MTQINPRYNLYQAYPNFKSDPVMPFMPEAGYEELSAPPLVADNQPVIELPDIYYNPNAGRQKESIKDTIKKVDVMDLVVPWFEHPLMMLATCFGISYGVDAFSRSCNKEYEKSILYKAAKFGDKIENSGFVQSKPVRKGLGYTKLGWGKVKDFAMKNSIIRSMVETPTSPENAMPKSEMLSTKQRVVEKFGEVVNKLHLVPDVNSKTGEEVYKKLRLRDIHLDRETVEALQKDFGVNKLSEVAEEKVISRYLLKNAGFSEAKIAETLSKSAPLDEARKLLVEKMGGLAHLKEILGEDKSKFFDEVLRLSDELKGIKITSGTKLPFVKKQFLTNVAGFQEVLNRGRSLSDNTITKTGQFMSKFLQKLHRGFTFGGAKTGVMLFVAPIIVRTLLNTHKADKDEKVGTFAHGMIEAVSWVFTFPIVLKAIHAFGGIQYAGMGKEKVAELKNLVKGFNDRVAAGEFKNYGEWKAARKAVKEEISKLRHVKNQDFVTRSLRKISEFSKSDLLKLKLYKGDNFFKDTVRNAPAKLKNFIWSAGRFAVFMFVGMSIADKIINKCTDTIFGKHYDDMLEKETAEAKKKQKEFLHKDLQDRMYAAQAKKMGSTQLVENLSPAEAKTEKVEAIETAKTEESQNAMAKAVKAQEIEKKKTQTLQNTEPVKSRVDNYTYIPSSENLIKKTVKPETGKYIPSQLPGNVGKTFDNSGLEAALRRADRAEASAVRILSGKFPD